MKTLFSLSFVALAASIGFASAEPAPLVTPTPEITTRNERAPAPPASAVVREVPAAAPAIVATESTECRDVNFMRPDVGAQKKFTLTFNVSASALKKCNPTAEVDDNGNGGRIVVTYGENGAALKMPVSASAGNVHTGRCINGETGDVSDVVLYRASWEGNIPNQIELKKMDRAFFDYSKALATCRKLTTANKFH